MILLYLLYIVHIHLLITSFTLIRKFCSFIRIILNIFALHYAATLIQLQLK